ncbi:hypothetical protein AB6A40_006191 [Gnathostoma spinigerum]|uniref:PID domain-containing protein n=1 Tax=Gnathostoma spinigerum TaxID=75299 RepID=A0ABD6EJU6_9BILA
MHKSYDLFFAYPTFFKKSFLFSRFSRNINVSEEFSNKPILKSGFLHRGMDRIRRSFRESLRRRSSRDRAVEVGCPAANSVIANSQPSSSSSVQNGKNEMWQPDEAAVRAGTCNFNVKYLGAVEVFESRGMQTCEGALKRLRSQRRRPVRAVLYISGDGIRVVDQETNRGLIVDQTIEKVSFCAPDRTHDKGFAYICRDGTSRRWMCHGFHATKETGERLSHAVGCAFAVCLERKKKRDAEAVAAVEASARFPSMSAAESRSTKGFTLTDHSENSSDLSPQMSLTGTFNRGSSAYNSFRRQLSITERLRDPQTAIVQDPPATSSSASTMTFRSRMRPVGNPSLFERQGSLKAPQSSVSNSAAFRRHFSLRAVSPDYQNFPVTNYSEPIIEDEEETYSANSASLSQPPLSRLQGRVLASSSCFYPSDTASPVLSNGVLSTNSSQHAWSSFDDTDEQNKYSFNRREHSLFHDGTGISSIDRSKADRWLEQTLKTSLSLNSPLRNHASNGAKENHVDVDSPPQQPPPPLPPSSFSSRLKHSEDDRVMQSSESMPTFRQDDSRCALPSINEDSAVNPEPNTVSSTSTRSQNRAVDVFGQSAFGQSVRSQSDIAKNGSLEKPTSITSKFKEECDPFDVKWSLLAMCSTSPTTQTSPKSTNPFCIFR